jgi:glycosyltransferase involved in cell wall biosynthesis
VLPPVRDFRLTILLVTYNRLPLLQRAVNQFLAQTSKDWRLRICDHGSTDGTTEFCEALAKAHPEHVEVLRKAINGGTEALGGIYQEMMASTETELVLGISDDDWLFPTHLEKTLGFFREHPWVGMVTAAYAGVTPEMALEFQYGPFYDTTGMADPQVELQRAFHAGVCPQGCIYRRALLREFATKDPLLVPGKDEFACWDYLVTTKMLAHFEVGYVNEVLTGITISPQTAFAGRDFAYEFLLLMEDLCSDYAGLFGAASFPFDLVNQFAQNIVLPMITRNFVHVLTSTASPQDLAKGLEAKRRSWEQFVQADQRIYVHASRTAPRLVG